MIGSDDSRESLPGRHPRPVLERLRPLGIALLGIAAFYLLLAYGVLPALWRHHEHCPAMGQLSFRTQTVEGIPGDPVNLTLVGEKMELVTAMEAAGWHPADPETARTAIDIAKSVVLDRPYQDAPVSALYLRGRKQDLAFEQLVGSSPRERHHVRFWKSDDLAIEGRPTWAGAATFDRKVGLSHLTGEITHHIGPDVDSERDKVIYDLEKVGLLVKVFQVTGVGPTLSDRNGEGDWYFTDGEVTVGILAPDNVAQASPAIDLPSPTAVKWKNSLLARVRPWLSRLHLASDRSPRARAAGG